MVLSYLPYFSAVCVLVTTATMADPAHPDSTHIDKATLLSCLFEGDSGRVSPNTVVSYNIRRHGGDLFSAGVRQYGFPYKWVQSLCGISGLTTGSGEGGGWGGGGGEWSEGSVPRIQVETSVESMTGVMRALREVQGTGQPHQTDPQTRWGDTSMYICTYWALALYSPVRHVSPKRVLNGGFHFESLYLLLS